MSYPPARLWLNVQLSPPPEPEPELVRANPNLLPALFVPAEWSEERRKAWGRKWGLSFGEMFGSNVHLDAPLVSLTLGKS